MGSRKRPRISRNGARLCPFQRARSLDLPFLFASSRKGEGAFRFLDQTPSQSTSDPDKYLLRETDGRLQRWKGLLCKPAQRSVKRRRKARHRRARSRGEIRKGDLPKPDFSGLQCCASVVVGLSHLLMVSINRREPPLFCLPLLACILRSIPHSAATGLVPQPERVLWSYFSSPHLWQC